MKFNYRFSNLLGIPYQAGNIIFTSDGNSLLSPVGNHVTIFDLVNHKAKTMSFETRKNIRFIALDHSSKLLIVVDVDGYALIVNFINQTVIHRFHFKKIVRVLCFSPDDKFFAVGIGNKIQVWSILSLHKESLPLVLYRSYSGHTDTVTTINWSKNGQYFVTGSKDNTSRIYSLNSLKDFTVVTLLGHRERIVAAYMLEDQILPKHVEQDVSLHQTKDRMTSDPILSLDEIEPCTVVYTISKDGALIIWRWVWLNESKEYNSKSEVSDNSNGVDGMNKIENKKYPLTINNGEWRRHARYFLQKENTRISSVAMHSDQADLIIVGFDNGVFSVFEMPSATHIQSLSVSKYALGSAAINCSGEWIAFASKKLGQLLVWEWKSETYVLKQQAHYYDVNMVAFSPDGQLLATGADDSKVKLWNVSSGFCFVTFSNHIGPITGLKFASQGNAVVSSSLDGTVRAFDLVRYRNFRTMTTPSPTQLTCLAIDGGGEIICAGAMDPPNIYVWSLQSGKLLDTLFGHEGPISSIYFNPYDSELASTSWDKTLRVWKPYDRTTPIETYELGSDGLCVAWRPDGKEICVGTLSGHLQFWDPSSGEQKGFIEGLRDISGGRRLNDRQSAKNATFNKQISSVCYTADGHCVIAGGRSKYVCIFHVNQLILLKKYQLSHNLSLDGVLDKLNSKNLTDVGPRQLADVTDDENSNDDRGMSFNYLPGATRGDLGKRNTLEEIRCKCIQFSPSGNEWAAATTEGLMIYSLNSSLLFDPVDLDENVTPDLIRSIIIDHCEYGKAFKLALHLGEISLIKEIYRSIPWESIHLVATSIPVIYLNKVIDIVAEELTGDTQIERHLSWALTLLTTHHVYLNSESSHFMISFRKLQKGVGKHFKDISKLCNDNMYRLFLLSNAQPTFSSLNQNEKEKSLSYFNVEAPKLFQLVNHTKQSSLTNLENANTHPLKKIKH